MLDDLFIKCQESLISYEFNANFVSLMQMFFHKQNKLEMKTIIEK